MPKLILLGIGTEQSPRFAPAGLLIEYGHTRVGIDGGPGSEPPENVDAWLVRDENGPLRPELLRIAKEGEMLPPHTGPFQHGPLHIEPLPVDSPARTVCGYRITTGHRTAVWAPESATIPPWATGATLIFADASTPETLQAATALNHPRVVFARIGPAHYPTLDAESPPPTGEWGQEGRTYRL